MTDAEIHITIVVPVHNRATLVERTLDSIAAQTLRPLRLIVVDNGSTDSTLAVVERWATAHRTDNFRVDVLTESKPGACAARNRGLHEVTTPYVLFFDSDDVMAPTHCADVLEGLKKADWPDIGVFGADLYDTAGLKIKSMPVRSGDILFNHLFHGILSTQRTVLKTDTLCRCGEWNEALPVWNDFELGVRLLTSGARAATLTLTEPVRIYSQADSITGTSFSTKAGLWERSLAAVEAMLSPRMRVYVDYRRAILCGMYHREGHSELVPPQPFKFNLITRFVALGGHGVAHIAKLLH